MEAVIKKLHFRGQDRIAIINAPERYYDMLAGGFGSVRIDTAIDARYLYEFMIVFVVSVNDIRELAASALHNITADGILWFVFPKKKNAASQPDISRDHGWQPVEDKGFRRVSQVSVDELWTALRFRNAAYVRRRGKKDT